MLQLFYYKMRQKFITGFLLQNTTVLSQIAKVIIKCFDFFTKSDSYYNMRRLLQNTPLQGAQISG